MPFILIFLRSNTGHEVCGVYMIFYMYCKVYSVMFRGAVETVTVYIHTTHTHVRQSWGYYIVLERRAGMTSPAPP